MKWEEIKKMYPNHYVVLEELESEVHGNKKEIKEVALVKVIDDPKTATRELVRSKGKQFVYHTAEEKIIIEISKMPKTKRKYQYEH